MESTNKKKVLILTSIILLLCVFIVTSLFYFVREMARFATQSTQVLEEYRKALLAFQKTREAVLVFDFNKAILEIKESRKHIEGANERMSEENIIFYLPYFRKRQEELVSINKEVTTVLFESEDLLTHINNLLGDLNLEPKSNSLADLTAEQQKKLILEIAESQNFYYEKYMALEKILDKSIVPEIDLGISSVNNIKDEYYQSLLRLKVFLSVLKDFSSYLPWLTGTEEPRTYLLLFQNSTEIRPTGGIISSYGILTLQNGKIINFEVSGIDALLTLTPGAPEPPEPIRNFVREFLSFVDANWFPDFRKSSQDILWFWEQKDMPPVHGVIALDTFFLEDLVKTMGKTKVPGYPYEFSPDNVVDKLEYEVEVAAPARGEKERKEVLGDLSKVLIERILTSSLNKLPSLIGTLKQSSKQKDILFYFPGQKELGLILRKHNLSGEIRQDVDDFIMVCDANLGSYKTDSRVHKSIEIKLNLADLDRASGKIVLTYDFENVPYDFKISNYHSFVRSYLSHGTKLVSTEGGQDQTQVAEDLNKVVFGNYIFVVPGDRQTLLYRFELSPEIREKIKQGEYSLYIQKQPGTKSKLSLEINFPKEWNKEPFKKELDLLTDREFSFKK